MMIIIILLLEFLKQISGKSACTEGALDQKHQISPMLTDCLQMSLAK